MPSGCSASQSPHETICTGASVSFVPVSGPLTASPRAWGHSEWVWRSYITRFEW